MNVKLRILVVAAALVSAPFTFNHVGQAKWNDASCQDEILGGTCCNQSASTCYPNNCSDAGCAKSNAYWKSEGMC
jgi:hypothetical protein